MMRRSTNGAAVVLAAVAIILSCSSSFIDAWGISSSSSSFTVAHQQRTIVATSSVLQQSSSSISSEVTNVASTITANNDNDILGKEKDKKWHAHCTEPGDRDILVRCASGATTERTPVWLMRQAGRYMAAFREYSTKIPFRKRSETPDIATELSLQCHRAYGMDGIIMFSDILTRYLVWELSLMSLRGPGR